MSDNKHPSSLDYDQHLNELALNNWRRALLADDPARAEPNAQRLAESPDRFWRFLGHVHLAITHLASGRPSAALDALADAARAYPESQPLVAIARGLTAHIHLETVAPSLAFASLQGLVENPHVRYWRALALARMSREEEARTLSSSLADGPLRLHVIAEIERDNALLQEASEAVTSEALRSPEPAAAIRFAHAKVMAAMGRNDEAMSAFKSLLEIPEVRLHWPLPYARALYAAGRLAERAGDIRRARDVYRTFVKLWGDGELDRAEISAATQFVSA